MKCELCEEKDNHITGKSIRTTEFKETYGYSSNKLVGYNDYLNLFILKGKKDEKAGLMIENIIGARYIDINYCPFCGRKLNNLGDDDCE